MFHKRIMLALLVGVFLIVGCSTQDDPTQRQPDISLAKEKLGWEPVIKLEQGLASTIDYFKTVVG